MPTLAISRTCSTIRTYTAGKSTINIAFIAIYDSIGTAETRTLITMQASTAVAGVTATFTIATRKPKRSTYWATRISACLKTILYTTPALLCGIWFDTQGLGTVA
jgi:hypothetical protein